MRSGGNDLGGEQIRRPEHKGISAASKSRSAKNRVRGLEAGSRPTLLLGKADDTKEETGKCTSWDRRGMGSGIGRKILRDNVGNMPLAAGDDSDLQGLLERG
jgi:hypothetical protein